MAVEIYVDGYLALMNTFITHENDDKYCTSTQARALSDRIYYFPNTRFLSFSPHKRPSGFRNAEKHRKSNDGNRRTSHNKRHER